MFVKLFFAKCYFDFKDFVEGLEVQSQGRSICIENFYLLYVLVSTAFLILSLELMYVRSYLKALNYLLG